MVILEKKHLKIGSLITWKLV